MSLLNTHLFGADPEFVVINNSNIALVKGPRLDAPWGIDHGGYVVEPHPKPEKSIRKLVDNLKVSFNDFAVVAPEGKWRAGAYISGMKPRNQALGGHIHIDLPKSTPAQVNALDTLTEYLEKLDILPSTECASRRAVGGYGKWGDIRTEHGHWEYRTMPSWLFSQRVTKLCLVGTKVAITSPELTGMYLKKDASLPNLKKFYEAYKGKDDDVDWFLEGGILDKKLSIDVTRDLREVWKVEAKKDVSPWKKDMLPTAILIPTARVRPAASFVVVDGVSHICVHSVHDTVEVRERIHARLTEGLWRMGAHLSTGVETFTVVARDNNWGPEVRLNRRQATRRDGTIVHYETVASQIGFTAINEALRTMSAVNIGRLPINRVTTLSVSATEKVAIRFLGVEREEEEDDTIDWGEDINDEF